MSITEPQYKLKGITTEHPSITTLAGNLNLVKHPSGGYFAETDRPTETSSTFTTLLDDKVDRNASSLIHFMMTCESPRGQMHTNVLSRTIHILQHGRGKYVLIHPDNRIETFIVGFNAEKGERTQWVVEPGVYKGCVLLPLTEGAEESNQDILWVSEVVVPGFDFQDMKFLDKGKLSEKVGEEKAVEMEFLL